MTLFSCNIKKKRSKAERKLLQAFCPESESRSNLPLEASLMIMSSPIKEACSSALKYTDFLKSFISIRELKIV